MKKKIDAMTVISIVLLVLSWLGFIVGIKSTSNSCDDFSTEMSWLNLEQLFDGVVYANNTVLPINRVSTLDFIIRGIIKNYANDSLYLVLDFNCVSDNKIYPIKKY